jgi:hypothetical protein
VAVDVERTTAGVAVIAVGVKRAGSGVSVAGNTVKVGCVETAGVIGSRPHANAVPDSKVMIRIL